MTTRVAVLAGLVLLTWAAPARAEEPAAPAAEVQLEDYVVEPGDTCSKIAKKKLGNGRLYTTLHKHNDLGPLPHKLRPGTIMKIPVVRPAAGPDAKVTRTAGSVRARPPTDNEWAVAALGTALWRAWRVGAEARSQAEVTFRDTSIVYVRENTVVVIYGPSAGRAREQVGEAVLERGSLRTRLGELAGDAPAGGGGERELIVSTPSAEARLGRGGAVVGAHDDGTTAVSNHGGKAAKVRGRDKQGKPKGKPVAVAAGMGSTVPQGQAPTPPRALPAAPAFDATAPTSFVSDDGVGGRVSFAWAAVPGAAQYRVSLARDADGADPVELLVVPADVTRFEAAHLPEGVYFASVATVGADHLEGAPGEALRLAVVVVAQRAPAGLDDAPPAGAAWLGTRLVAPAGLACQVGDAPPGPEVVLATAGRVDLRCQDASGRASPPVVIEVVAPAVQVTQDAGGALVVVGPAGLVPRLAVTVAGRDVPVVVRAPGRAEAQLAAGAGRAGGGPVTVEVVLRVDGRAIVLARTTAVVATAIDARPAPAAGARTWELGLFASLDGSAGGDEASAGPGVPDGAAGMGLRAGRRLGGSAAVVELELRAGSVLYTRGTAQHSELQLAGTLGLRWEPTRGPARVFLAAGLGAEWLPQVEPMTDGATGTLRKADDLSATAHAGGGGLVELAPGLGLRLDVRARARLGVRTSREDGDLPVAAEVSLGGFLAF